MYPGEHGQLYPPTLFSQYELDLHMAVPSSHSFLSLQVQESKSHLPFSHNCIAGSAQESKS